MPPMTYTIKRGWLLGRALAELMKRLNREEEEIQKVQYMYTTRAVYGRLYELYILLRCKVNSDHLRLDFSLSVSP